MLSFGRVFCNSAFDMYIASDDQSEAWVAALSRDQPSEMILLNIGGSSPFLV